MSDRRVERILTVLAQRWRERIQVTELAERVCLSPSRLEHLFKTELGLSIRDYVRERRLDEAARLLRETDERISEIGYEVGFSDPSNFSNAFRHRFGESPRSYRLSHLDASAQLMRSGTAAFPPARTRTEHREQKRPRDDDYDQ